MSAAASTRPAWRVNVAELLLDDLLPAGGDRSAIRFPGGEWTLEELALRVGGLAGDLRDRGVSVGDRVALMLPNAPSWWWRSLR